MHRFILIVLMAGALSGAVPTPEQHFGFPMGAERKLASWDQVVSYFQALDRESDRVSVAELGRTTEDKPFIAATIASPETLAQLDHYLSIQQKLADPRGLDEAGAHALAAQGKTVVMITCSIHSTEVASTHTAVEFAYRMATAEDKKTRAILDNVIFLLVPSLNPDGVEIVRRWYEKTLDTDYEGTNPPELYQKYIGHDNNRDWYIFSQAETRIAISKLHNVWHPQIVYDVHQQGAFRSRMFIPPWLDPIEPNIDPLITQLCNMIGTGMAADLTAAGKKGVVINASYDFWTPARHYQAYHGGMRILSESASARLATTIEVQPRQIGETARGYNPRRSSWNYLEPWLGGRWSMRDIIDYQLLAWESCLYQAALRREDLLLSFYKIGRRATERQSPYAFVIPINQFDPGAAAKLLDTLAFGMIEIERADEEFTADGERFPPGSYVVRMQQPYSSWAKALLERQDYPDLRLYPGGPPKRPYDVTAHTLPLLMGVDVVTVNSPFEAVLAPAKKFGFFLQGRRPAKGGFPASDVNSWKEVNRIWDAGRPVWRDRLTGDFYPEQPDGLETFAVSRPKIGLYRSWLPNIDEGWTRWILEQFGFAYDRVSNDDIIQGNLRQRWNVIVFPDQNPRRMAEGYRRGSMPVEYTGGLNNRAVASLKAYLADGGTLVFLNQSTGFAIDQLNIHARNALDGVRNTDYYAPGSLLNATLIEQNPLTYGLPRQITVWAQGSPAFEPNHPHGARTIAQFPKTGILASGWLLGEQRIAGLSPLVEIPVAKGLVILFGMRPQYRGQSYQTFKLFFNALLQ